jgi:Flp pilus assembly protein TadD
MNVVYSNAMSRVLRPFALCAVLLASILVQVSGAFEPTASEEAALQAYRQGAFSRAVQLYTVALSETDDPTHRAQLHVRIAWTLFALGREAEVETHLRAALVEDPTLTLATDYYTQQFVDLFEAARSSAAKGGAPSPDAPPSPDVEATLAAIQTRLDRGEDLEGALADVDRLLIAFPGDARLAPLKVALLERLGRTEEAAALRAQYGLGGPTAPLATLSIPDLILRANRLLDEGDVEGSLEVVREVVARQPNNVAGLELMAEAARRAARWQEAEFALKSALGLQPDNIGLRLRLGEVYLAMGDTSGARDAFRQLTERWPHSDRAWAALGLLDARLGRPQRAIEELHTALSENPLLPEVQLAVGELELAAGHAEQAIEALRAAENLLHDDAQVQARLGQALLLVGKTNAALTALRAAVAGDFQPPDVRRAFALALIQSDLFAEAQRIVDKLEASDDTTLLTGLLQLKRGAFADAEASVRPVLQRRPNDPAVLNLLAASLYRQGRFADAANLLAQAEPLATGSPILEANLSRAVAADAADHLLHNALEVVPR